MNPKNLSFEVQRSETWHKGHKFVQRNPQSFHHWISSVKTDSPFCPEPDKGHDFGQRKSKILSFIWLWKAQTPQFRSEGPEDLTQIGSYFVGENWFAVIHGRRHFVRETILQFVAFLSRKIRHFVKEDYNWPIFHRKTIANRRHNARKPWTVSIKWVRSTYFRTLAQSTNFERNLSELDETEILLFHFSRYFRERDFK